MSSYVIANVSMESVALVSMLILLIPCIAQKKHTSARKAFLRWNINLICLLVCQLLMWFTLLDFFPFYGTQFVIWFNRVLFIIDAFLFEFLTVSFYQYIISLLKEKRPFNEKQQKSFRWGYHALVIWAVIFTALFATSLWTGTFYQFDAQNFIHYTRMYIVPASFASLGLIINSVVIVRNSRHFGGMQTFLLLSYFYAPLFLLPIDFRYNLCLSYIMYAFITMAIYIEVDIGQSRELALQEARLAKHETEMTQMRVNLMMSQIQPHFLYNALSSISYLCTKDPQEAEAATNEFASYLKSNLRSINSQHPIPFETELQHVENYLKIQKRRFLDRMRVEYRISSRDFHIPALTLQTIVENAVRHGVEARFEPTTICISTEETENTYEVVIHDDGPGFDVNAAPDQDRLHLGIESTRSRLSEMVGGTLTIESTPGAGTAVTISIPKRTEAQKA